MADIGEKSGWISFADYMQQVLYTPLLGYYSGSLVKLGEAGDFTTAPEMTDLYGRTLAQAMIPLLEQTGANILELGAGTGKLAFDVLTALAGAGIRIGKYRILELSAELRQRQQVSLKGFDNVEWLTVLPERFDGVVLACIDFGDPEVIELVQSSIPVVTIDYLFNNRIAIMSDNVCLLYTSDAADD